MSSMWRAARLLVAIGLAAASSACASIVSETDSATYIETAPEKARCELHGQDFKRLVETPNSINLPAKAAPLTVSCRADGYKTTTATLDTKMDGWIFGNIIFGGIIGGVVDAARGAGQKYPPKFSVLLEPERFPDTARRDEFYAQRKAMTQENWSKALRDAQAQCSTPENVQAGCGDRIAKAEAARDKELAEIEHNRLTATIDSGATANALSTPEASPVTPVKRVSPSVVSTEKSSTDIESQLRKLKRMQEDGLISAADYEAQKKKLLERN